MATDILTEEQRKAYGSSSGDPTPDQLTYYCYLDPTDRVFIKMRRTAPYLQLDCALQLMTVRFLGTFPEEPLAVPKSVVAFAAEQLGISNWSDLSDYGKSRAPFDNRLQIRERYGYKDFDEGAVTAQLLRRHFAVSQGINGR